MVREYKFDTLQSDNLCQRPDFIPKTHHLKFSNCYFIQARTRWCTVYWPKLDLVQSAMTLIMYVDSFISTSRQLVWRQRYNKLRIYHHLELIEEYGILEWVSSCWSKGKPFKLIWVVIRLAGQSFAVGYSLPSTWVRQCKVTPTLFWPVMGDQMQNHMGNRIALLRQCRITLE